MSSAAEKADVARVSPLKEVHLSEMSHENMKSDPWLAYDKLVHYSFGLMWMLSSYYVVNDKWEFSKNSSIQISFASGLGISIGKECLDKYKRHTFFSVRDILAATAGMVTGILIINK